MTMCSLMPKQRISELDNRLADAQKILQKRRPKTFVVSTSKEHKSTKAEWSNQILGIIEETLAMSEVGKEL